MNELTISLDQASPRPLYEQIYAYIKDEIQNGGLPRDERLPSSRMLARHLEVSRSTVALAYEQLLSEGYIYSQPGRGYFVNSLEGLYRLPADFDVPAPAAEAEHRWAYDFSPSGVDLGSFPGNVWRRISRGLLAQDDPYFFQQGEPEGEEELRQVIASYVHQARGVRCTAQQIIVGAGNDYLLMLLCAILGGRRVCAMENPTYKKAWDILEILGNEMRAVAADEGGMEAEALEKSGASIAYVMPAHQYPLGIVMPAGRRRQLLNWAAAGEGRYIIEDDYDSEFRYRGRPIPALQGLDGNDRVIYLGTFSKSIAPAIRISFLVLPKPLLSAYRERGRRFSSTVPRMEQKILAEFIRSGAYERHLNRMRSVYKARHDALLESLKAHPQAFRVSGEYAGTHLLAALPEGVKERQAAEAAKKADIRVYGLSEYEVVPRPAGRAVLILGYANMEEEKIKRAVSLLTEIVGQLHGRGKSGV